MTSRRGYFLGQTGFRLIAALAVMVLGRGGPPAEAGAPPEPARPVASVPSAPLEATTQMTLPRGFRATLCAAEPDVFQPIAMTIDHRGRLWVAEAYTYPTRAPEGKGRDRILILEDKDGDGVASGWLVCPGAGVE